MSPWLVKIRRSGHIHKLLTFPPAALSSGAAVQKELPAEQCAPHHLLERVADQLEIVVAFIYHGEVNILEEELSNFILVANELQLKGLTALYEKEPNRKTLKRHWSCKVCGYKSKSKKTS